MKCAGQTDFHSTGKCFYTQDVKDRDGVTSFQLKLNVCSDKNLNDARESSIDSFKRSQGKSRALSEIFKDTRQKSALQAEAAKRTARDAEGSLAT